MTDQIIAPRRSEILSNDGVGTNRFMEYLERTAAHINVSTDNAEIDTNPDASIAAIAALEKRLSDITVELPGFTGTSSFQSKRRIVDVTADITTKGDSILILNNDLDITVTLNDSPKDGESVTLAKKTDFLVTIIGLISGATPNDLIFNGDTLGLIYTGAAGEWSPA